MILSVTNVYTSYSLLMSCGPQHVQPKTAVMIIFVVYGSTIYMVLQLIWQVFVKGTLIFAQHTHSDYNCMIWALIMNTTTGAIHWCKSCTVPHDWHVILLYITPKCHNVASVVNNTTITAWAPSCTNICVCNRLTN